MIIVKGFNIINILKEFQKLKNFIRLKKPKA